ncbi:MAG: HAD family phosphatase, partial [Chloroflexi bacterium]|nr:HAD family phosphatase [Chloroflexota bacterium]
VIKALFFDIGGVLLRTEDLSGRQKWERRFGLPDWGLADVVFNNEIAARATIGRATQDDVWAHVAVRFNLTEDEIAELQRDFWAGDRFDEELIGFVASMRPRYRTGVISNAWPGTQEFLARHPAISAAFERLIISAEVGIAKPDPRIFRLALGAFGVAPRDAVFVDDVLENVEAARGVGMAGVHFTDPVRTREAVDRLLRDKEQ